MDVHHALMGTIDRRGYGANKKALFMMLVDHISLNLMHTEASFSPNSIDLLTYKSLRHLHLEIW